jgi:predicted O-methyltransferase YrrM
MESRLVESIEWSAVHGATFRTDDNGFLILRDGATLDWHLLRWTDPRLNGVRIKLSVIAKPVAGCDTCLYVHHWGDKDVCSIAQDGTVVLSEGAEEVHVKHLPDAFLAVTIIFENNHPTLSLGVGKPLGRYQGTGADQYAFKRIEVELLPLNATRKMIIDRLWRGYDPLHNIPSNLFEFDLQGWNSQHPYLSEAIDGLRPSIIVEIGVWKGGSTVFMANRAKALGLASVVLAVDTWLGSSDHWLTSLFTEMSFFAGYPALYQKFLSNVVRAGVADYVLPIPIDSLNAAQILQSLGVSPGMIHLDGGHDYESVTADLRAWWPLLAPGGALIGDDYFTTGMWPTVRLAFDDFFRPLDLLPIEHGNGKCRVRKPH